MKLLQNALTEPSAYVTGVWINFRYWFCSLSFSGGDLHKIYVVLLFG